MSNKASTLGASPHHPEAAHDRLALAGMWFPPYGNLGAQSAGTKASASSFADALKKHEDRVAELIGNLNDAERAIAYKYLHASGMRIGTVDDDLRKAIRREISKEN